MNYPTNNINNFSINDSKDVLLFLMHLTLDFCIKICCHDNIVNIPEEWDKFEKPDQDYLKSLIQRCFDVCERDNISIFTLTAYAQVAPEIANIENIEDDEE